MKKDPRYGQMAPHHGMPKGHLPVTSYLAVPVIARSGEVLGGLFFGHSQPARFTAVHERVTKALAATRGAGDRQRQAAQAPPATPRRTSAASPRSLRETVRFNELFVGVLAHDLRAPLAAMLTAAELLEVAPAERARTGTPSR